MLTAAEPNATLVGAVVPADGTYAATWRERRLRFGPDLWAALGQATACLCVLSIITWRDMKHNSDRRQRRYQRGAIGLAPG